MRELETEDGANGVKTVNMIEAYADTSVRVESQHIIQTLTEMANEEIANDVGHLTRQDMIDIVLNKNIKVEHTEPTFKNKGEENFSVKDKLSSFIERKI